jgi:hypothetical protein
LRLRIGYEKRMAWPYAELENAPFFGDPTGYGYRWVNDAVRAGFLLLGWARDLKGPMYRASYAMLVSPEGNTFIAVGVGTVLNFTVQSTSVYSPSADGRCFYTTDSQASVKIDLSRNCMNQLAPVPSLAALLRRHPEWVQSLGLLPRFFTPGREYGEFRVLREQHFRSMQRAGLIRFLDASATYFQFTLSGAARTAIWSYLLGMIGSCRVDGSRGLRESFLNVTKDKNVVTSLAAADRTKFNSSVTPGCNGES